MVRVDGMFVSWTSRLWSSPSITNST